MRFMNLDRREILMDGLLGTDKLTAAKNLITERNTVPINIESLTE